MFQTRHLNALAFTLAASRPGGGENSPEFYQWNLMVERIARMVCESNPRASKQRFVEACWKG